MKNYSSYMDRQTISQETHDRLLELKARPRNRTARPWMAAAALAACALLAVGLWRFAPAARPPAEPGPAPAVDGSQSAGGPAMLPFMPAVDYLAEDQVAVSTADRAFVKGSFREQLSRTDILALLWNGEEDPDVPGMLFWEGYDLAGTAMYAPDGALLEVWLSGEREDGAQFSIDLAPGGLPFTCTILKGGSPQDIRGVEVTAWETGGGYELEFAANGVGVRASFVGVADSLLPDAFVNWCTYSDGGLSLDHLLAAETLPAWREAEYGSLAEVRASEPEFAPYLPETDFSGYDEFAGLLSYQEGEANSLHLRWSWGYDDVVINIDLPEGETDLACTDVSDPAGYDVRLYSIPWADSVPAEYFGTFHRPIFRAGDMSREVVAARAYTVEDAGDTDALRIDFTVLHPDGTLVQYNTEGLTVDRVWAMVEATL